MPAEEPKDYVKCLICGAGWLMTFAVVVGGEAFCSDECAAHRTADLIIDDVD